MSRLVITAAVLVLVGGPASAQPSLDPEVNGQLLWRIVVKTEPHPLLGPSFKDQVKRDLMAALQPAIGGLGTVDVLDLEDALAGKADALVQDFHAKGFTALDAPRDLTGVKTHFLQIDYRDGQYHLESRQHDGFVGLASPVSRKQSVRSPELVGRTAGLMIDRDFGLAGTLDPANADATEVTVKFRGGKLEKLDRYVKAGDVFALARISKAANRAAPPPARTATGKVIAPPPGSVPPAALTPAVHAYTFLRVAAVNGDGTARCTVIRSPNYKATLPGGVAVQGYRCLKLNTIQAPIAIRIVKSKDDDGRSGASTVNVRATENAFTAKDDPKDYLDFRDGLYRSTRSFSNLACVTITLGKTKSEHFPVPVLSTEPIRLYFETNPEAEARAVFERSAIALSVRASDSRIAQVAAFDGIGKLIAAQKNDEALARARAAFEAADAADKVLSEEMEQLKPQGTNVAGAAALFTNVERQLAAIRASNTQLAARILELDAVVNKAKDSSSLPAEVKAQSLNTRIKLLLESGEVEEALVALDQLATLAPNNPEIKARREKLAAEWKPKDEAHAKAREYLLKTWPALATVPDLHASLAQLRANVEICKKAGDKHAFRRLLGILGAFPARLDGIVRDIDGSTDMDRKTLNDAKIVLEFVAKIEQEVVAYLKTE